MEALRSLETGIRAIRTQRQALHTIGHNIANVNTPGFSRQRAILATTLPQGSMGTGVKVETVERTRDRIIDYYIRKENPTLKQWDAKNEILEEMEILFNEPSEAGIGTIMSNFWNSWADLANNPEDGSARASVREQAKTLCDAFSQLYNSLKDLQSNIDTRIRTEVERLNSIIHQIGDLNQKIERIELGGQVVSNDLRDQRDLLIDKLSDLINFSYQEMDDGTVKISVYGQLLVSKSKIAEFTTEAGENGYLDIKWEDNKEKVIITNGELKGLIDTRDEIIPEFLQRLDGLASSLINKMNTLHQKGMGLDGTSQIIGSKELTGQLGIDGSFAINGVNITLASTDTLSDIINKINAQSGTTGVEASISGNKLVLTPYASDPQIVCITADSDGIMLKLGILNNFFKGKGVEDIALDDAIEENLNYIAASGDGAPGDNSNALAISQLKDGLTMEGNSSTFADYYNGTIGKLGVEAKETSQMKDNRELLLKQLENRRQSICGVSLDEEMTNIILFQQAYRMSVNFLKVINDMLDILTTSMGV